MRRALLIAGREYRQHIRTRGFWIGLLLIPMIMVASIAIPTLLDAKDTGDAILFADLSGRFQPAIEQVLERGYQKTILRRLTIYAQEYDAHPPGAEIDWARHALWYSDAEADRFVAAGGIAAALSALQPALPAQVVPFEIPHRSLRLAPFPDGISPAGPNSALDASLPPYLHGEPNFSDPDGPHRVVAAVVLPASLDLEHPRWRMWTNGAANGGIIQSIAEAIRQKIRDDALSIAGTDGAALGRIETADISPLVSAPPLGGTASATALRQLIPLGCAWMLWMTIMMVSNVLLHGVIEERSNKLIETLLATVTAQELMAGKLLGVAGIGFTIAVTWTGFAVASIGFAPPDLALVLHPALEPYASAAMVFALVFYFVAGYLTIATLFLVIGAMCDSMHDAQAYMTPLIVALLAPLVLIRPALSDPHGLLPVLLSWIPIYTPFVMLARLGTDVSTFELVASGVLLSVFIAIELVAAGRIFRANLLRTGQPPRFMALLRLCFARDRQ
jgi:ABC-2 type transport system permease protein